MVHKSHDNNKGDAVFTVFYKYGSKGAQSATFDKELDDLIAKATGATWEEREKLWLYVPLCFLLNVILWYKVIVGILLTILKGSW